MRETVKIRIERTPQNIAVIAGDMLSAQIHAEGRLDVAREMLECLREYIPVGGMVIDVGAYIGDHTATYSDFVGPTGRVLAIEPNPIALKCLEHNTMGRFNVTIVNCALGSRRTTADFIFDSGDISAARLTNDDEGHVNVLTLDSMFQVQPRLDFLKIDAEGFEPMILNGARETIMRLRPTILIELNPFMLGKYGFEADDVMRRMENLNYVELDTYGTDGNYRNVLFRPRS